MQDFKKLHSRLNINISILNKKCKKITYEQFIEMFDLKDLETLSQNEINRIYDFLFDIIMPYKEIEKKYNMPDNKFHEFYFDDYNCDFLKSRKDLIGCILDNKIDTYKIRPFF